MLSFSKDQQDQMQKISTIIGEKTGCNLVIEIVAQSASYHSVTWFVSAISGLISAIVLLIFSYQNLFPSNWEIAILISVQVLFMTGVYLVLKYTPSLRLFFVSKKKAREIINSKSKKTFLKKEIYNSKNRSGILLYISVLEKMIKIEPDTGIQYNTSHEDWIPLANELEKGLREKTLFTSLEKVLHQLEKFLTDKGFRANKVISGEIISGSDPTPKNRKPL